MTERPLTGQTTKSAPDPEALHDRWLSILAQFDLWTQIWAANPELAKQAGSRVEELMMPIEAARVRYTGYLD